MNMENLKEVFSDKAFVKGLFELETAAEVQASLKERGVEMTEEEILGVRNLLIKMENGEISVEQLENGELPDEVLEQVSGGALVFIGLVAGSVALIALVRGIVHAVERRW